MIPSKTKHLAAGAAAGLTGTALIQAMLIGTKRWLPKTLPPLKDDPAHFMVSQAKRILPSNLKSGVPPALEKAVGSALPFGYGLTFATAYAAARPGERVLLDGTALGLATWAAGYLGWLPATRLMPPVWKQETKRVLPNLLSHVVFGIATVAALKWLKRRL